jgi:hypothetical protein
MNTYTRIQEYRTSIPDISSKIATAPTKRYISFENRRSSAKTPLLLGALRIVEATDVMPEILRQRF